MSEREAHDAAWGRVVDSEIDEAARRALGAHLRFAGDRNLRTILWEDLDDEMREYWRNVARAVLRLDQTPNLQVRMRIVRLKAEKGQ